MEEMFEYLVPLTGLFKKKRNPKVIEAYKEAGDFEEIVADFKSARSYLNDEIRIGSKCVFCKEKITVYYRADITKAEFIVCGEDDDYAVIDLTFRDGSSKRIYKSYETDGTKGAFGVVEVLNGN